MDGFICIDKPVGPSSFSAAQYARRSLGIKKAGHAGTLDPMASGLLVVAAGKCTRLLRYLSLEPKVYEFSVIFGESTDTLDATGNVIARNGAVPSEDRLAGVLKRFTGEIEQIPPKYSAIKIDGTRAYELARKGVDVEMRPRSVNIYSIDMRGYDRDAKRADLTVGCSAGTYVRTLAADIAAAAGALGHVSELRRTRTGRFDVSAAVSLESLKAPDFVSNGIRDYFIDAWDAFDGGMKTVVAEDQVSELSFGRDIVIGDEDHSDVLIAFDGAKTLSAVLKRIDGQRYHPVSVFR